MLGIMTREMITAYLLRPRLPAKILSQRFDMRRMRKSCYLEKTREAEISVLIIASVYQPAAMPRRPQMQEE